MVGCRVADGACHAEAVSLFICPCRNTVTDLAGFVDYSCVALQLTLQQNEKLNVGLTASDGQWWQFIRGHSGVLEKLLALIFFY